MYQRALAGIKFNAEKPAHSGFHIFIYTCMYIESVELITFRDEELSEKMISLVLEPPFPMCSRDRNEKREHALLKHSDGKYERCLQCPFIGLKSGIQAHYNECHKHLARNRAAQGLLLGQSVNS